MTIIRAQVQFDSQTNLPADVITNTFHFNTNAVMKNWANLDDIIFDFYSEPASGNMSSIINYMTTDAVKPRMTIKYYDLDQDAPRVPAHEETRSLSIASGDPLPSEVAVCLSFQGVKESGVNQANRRNRVYLGGLSQLASSGLRPSAAFRTVVAKQARTMLAAANSAVAWEWVVYSPTTGVQTTVDNGWIDDSWDTQRRRGLLPSSRITWDDTNPS